MVAFDPQKLKNKKTPKQVRKWKKIRQIWSHWLFLVLKVDARYQVWTNGIVVFLESDNNPLKTF